MPRMVTIKAAAEATGLTYSCIRQWILSGIFTYYVKSGNKYFLNLDKLVEFLNCPASEQNDSALPSTSNIHRIDP